MVQIAEALRKVTVAMQQAIDSGERARAIDAEDLIQVLLAVADELDPPMPSQLVSAADACPFCGERHPDRLVWQDDQVVLVLPKRRLSLGLEDSHDLQRNALGLHHGADRVLRGAEELPTHGLSQKHNKAGAALILRRNLSPGGDLPICHRGIIGADTLNAGRPVLVGKPDLTRLSDEIAHLPHSSRFAPDRLGVGDGQCRCAS